MHEFEEETVYGGNDDGRGKPIKTTISTRNLKWAHLARYLNLEFKDLNLPEDQKTVTVLNEHFVVVLPARLSSEQKQDIDRILRGNPNEVEEFLLGLKQEKEEE